MDRRRFIAGVSAALGTVSSDGIASAWPGLSAPGENVAPRGLQEPALLEARPAAVDGAEAWTIGGVVPSPTLRVRRGERLRVRLRNGLPEPTILHWHGLSAPQEADGHPRLAIPTGATYDYDFQVTDPAGTYWFHPHPHRRTAAQTYRGIAGFLIVEDPEEEDLGLPSGDRDVPLLLRDRRPARGGGYDYAPTGPDLMLGHLGNTGFANGRPRPRLRVPRAAIRLRVLNGCNARILDLRIGEHPFAIVGADGGLLPVPVSAGSAMLGPAERLDLVLDLSRARPGEVLAIRSAPFSVPGMMAGPRGGPFLAAMGGGQGAEMTFAELVVDEREGPPAALAPRLRSLPPLDDVESLPRREFRFESAMMAHSINGRAFEMDRVDVRVPRDRPEIWRFVNDSPLPHPVHVHLGSYRVVSRTGGRGRIEPWERGTKDTVLVWPGERVDVRVHFREHAGLYLLHCHNLEHEDAGMMANFLVEDRPEV